MTFGKLIGGARARDLVQGRTKAELIDLADPVSFRDNKIEGSINVPLRRISTFGQYPSNKPIVLLGDAADPQTLTSALKYIEGYGLTNVYYLKSRADYLA